MTKERENTPGWTQIAEGEALVLSDDGKTDVTPGLLKAASMAWAEYERLLADSADATGDKATGPIWAADAMKQFTLRLRKMAGE